jgi:ABC-type glycerol-3-phosphate transport system substrate-binding protein
MVGGLFVPSPREQGGWGQIVGFVFFRTKVADYSKWKPVFDQDAADRQAAGSQGLTWPVTLPDPSAPSILVSVNSTALS